MKCIVLYSVYRAAAKTSAYYSIAPFIGTFLSFLIFQEDLTLSYFIGFIIMILGTIIVVIDTLSTNTNSPNN